MNELEVTNLLSQMRAMKSEAMGHKPAAATESGAAGGIDFASMLKQSVNSVNEQQKSARTMQEDFLTGSGNVGLEEVMIAVEKASLSFQAMSQVRKKLVTAYQEVMRMQV